MVREQEEVKKEGSQEKRMKEHSQVSSFSVLDPPPPFL